MKKYTQEEYIEKCRQKHGDTYILDKIVYNGMEKEVTPECRIHGLFPIKAWDFVNRYGCSKCAYEAAWKRNTKTTEEYKKEYEEKAKIKYDLSRFIYHDAKTKSIFICHKKDIFGNEHGEFESTPPNMLDGGICPICKSEKRILPEDIYYERCETIHKGFYKYDRTAPFLGLKSIIKPICPIHGPFEQQAGRHLNGAGCRECANIKKAAAHTDNKDSFVIKARKKHGQNYEYIGEYDGTWSKMLMKCNRCGKTFEQYPNIHLQGCGCPYCNRSKMEETVALLLDEKSIKYTEWKTFVWLIKKSKPQSLDFYLEDYNVAIECQGLQHFKPYGFKGSEKRFIEDQERDERKRRLCKEHDVPLYYINYNEDIKTKLDEILKEIGII